MHPYIVLGLSEEMINPVAVIFRYTTSYLKLELLNYHINIKSLSITASELSQSIVILS